MPTPVWSPPLTGVFKLNVDANLAVNAGLVGIGLVIRDAFGRVRAASSIKLTAFFFPLLAEVVVIFHGVRLAFNSGFLPVLVEYDALGAINVLKEDSIPCSDLGLVIFDIFLVCRSLSVLSFSLIHRGVNKVADALAKATLSFIYNVV
ncbi:hypothetical protein ACOSQ3_014791 [Xanthoceras sorbifolium]